MSGDAEFLFAICAALYGARGGTGLVQQLYKARAIVGIATTRGVDTKQLCDLFSMLCGNVLQQVT